MTNQEAIERLVKIADRFWLSAKEKEAIAIAVNAIEAVYAIEKERSKNDTGEGR